MSTILVDNAARDLLVDADNNLAIAGDPFALAQDVASSCLMFKDEHPFFKGEGIPYMDSILGKKIQVSLLKEMFSRESLRVVGIVSATPVMQMEGRTLKGNILLTDTKNNTFKVGLG